MQWVGKLQCNVHEGNLFLSYFWGMMKSRVYMGWA
jgi:hypothetical protein